MSQDIQKLPLEDENVSDMDVRRLLTQRKLQDAEEENARLRQHNARLRRGMKWIGGGSLLATGLLLHQAAKQEPQATTQASAVTAGAEPDAPEATVIRGPLEERLARYQGGEYAPHTYRYNDPLPESEFATHPIDNKQPNYPEEVAVSLADNKLQLQWRSGYMPDYEGDRFDGYQTHSPVFSTTLPELQDGRFTNEEPRSIRVNADLSPPHASFMPVPELTITYDAGTQAKDIARQLAEQATGLNHAKDERYRDFMREATGSYEAIHDELLIADPAKLANYALAHTAKLFGALQEEIARSWQGASEPLLERVGDALQKAQHHTMKGHYAQAAEQTRRAANAVSAYVAGLESESEKNRQAGNMQLPTLEALADALEHHTPQKAAGPGR